MALIGIAMTIKQLFYIGIVVFIAACSSEKADEPQSSDTFKDTIEALELKALFGEEPVDHSHILLTFSSSNARLRQYPLFKLGINDIVVEVSVDDQIYRQSLYNKVIASDLYLDSAVGIDLTNNEEDNYLYHGIYKVPAGKLEKIEIAFSGSRSEITILGKEIKLVDSFFSLFSHEDNTNPDGLPIQTLPVIVQTKSINEIKFDTDDLNIINIDVDMDMTVNVDALQSDDGDREYAVFSPSFAIQSLPGEDGFVKPFTLAFKDFQYINMALGQENLMALGNPQERLFVTDYSLFENTEITLDGSMISDLSDVDDTYYVDLTGEMTIDASGYHYKLSKGHLFSVTDNDEKTRFEGIVTKATDQEVTIAGQKLDLTLDDYSHLGGREFNQVIEGKFSDLAEGSIVVLLSDEYQGSVDVIQKLDSRKNENAKIIDVQSSVINAPVDMMGVKLIEELSGSYRVDLSESLPCNAFINVVEDNDSNPCSNKDKIKTIELTKTTKGNYKIIEIRRGEIDTLTTDEGGDSVFIHDPNLVAQFISTSPFIKVLEDKSDKGGRVVRFTGDGEMRDDTFVISDKLTVVILYPQDSLDNATESDDAAENDVALKGMLEHPLLKGILFEFRKKKVSAVNENFKRQLKHSTRVQTNTNTIDIAPAPAKGILKKRNQASGVSAISASPKKVRFKSDTTDLTKRVNTLNSKAVLQFSTSQTKKGNQVVVNNQLDQEGYLDASKNVLNGQNVKALNNSLKSMSGLSTGVPGDGLKAAATFIDNSINNKRTAPPLPPRPGASAPPPPPPPPLLPGEDRINRAQGIFSNKHGGGEKATIAELNPFISKMTEAQFSKSLTFIGEFETWRTQVSLGNYYDADTKTWKPTLKTVVQPDGKLTAASVGLYNKINTHQTGMDAVLAELKSRFAKNSGNSAVANTQEKSKVNKLDIADAGAKKYNSFVDELNARINAGKIAVIPASVENTPESERIKSLASAESSFAQTGKTYVAALAPGVIPPPPPPPPLPEENANNKNARRLQANLLTEIQKQKILRPVSAVSSTPTVKSNAGLIGELNSVLSKRNQAAVDTIKATVPPSVAPKPIINPDTNTTGSKIPRKR
jgi:hypothetical protein